MLFDADLSLANAQIALGCATPYNMSHFLAGQKTLAEIVVKTRQGVMLVPGASGMLGMAAIDPQQTAQMVREFSAFDQKIDYLVVDLPAGISPMVMTLLSACTRRFVVIQDDPSSIADAYGTIKVMVQNQKLDEIYLIPNAVESEAHGRQLHARINQVCAKFLDRTVRYLGAIEKDEMILQSLKKFQSVLDHAPGSAAARDFRRLADSVEQLPKLPQLSGGIQFFVERLVQTAT